MKNIIKLFQEPIIVRASQPQFLFTKTGAGESRTLKKPIVRPGSLQAVRQARTSRLPSTQFVKQIECLVARRIKSSKKVSLLNLFWPLVIIWMVFPICFSSSVVYAQDLPRIIIDHTVDKTKAQPGDLLTYRIHYQNRGTAPAYHLRLKHYLPKGTTLLSASHPLAYWSERKLVFNLNDLLPQDGQIITVQARVNQELKKETILTSRAVLEYRDSQQRADPIVFDIAETLIEFKPTLPAVSAKEIKDYEGPLIKAVEAKAGSEIVLTNLLLACLAATLGMGLVWGFDKLRKLIKIK